MQTQDTPALRRRHGAKVDTSGGLFSCWPWTAAQDGRGYGIMRVAGHNVRAARIAWVLAVGPIPPGLHVLHRCDNPPCCNPSHLFLGTHADNMADMRAKGRAGNTAHPERAARGERHGSARLNATQVNAIRARYAAGGISQPALAAEYGVHQATVWRIVRGLRWTHVP